MVPRNGKHPPSLSYIWICLLLQILYFPPNTNRTLALKQSGECISKSVKSSDAYLRTILVIKERAIDVFVVPLTICTLNAVIWTILINVSSIGKGLVLKDHIYTDVLSATLAFLLVFRLNRAALRWWDTRRMWGAIVANVRMMADGIMTHTTHAPNECNDAIRWLAGFLIATKQHLRNYDKFYIDSDELAGFLSKDEILLISEAPHPVLYTASEIRLALKQAFHVSYNTSAAIGVAYSSQLCLLEQLLNNLIDNMGGLERVKSTPLPIAFVTHLRTFCMLYLLSLPYLYSSTWGWGTISSVFLTSFALLGIDGAASECERPFKSRPNALNMEAFCLTGLNNIAQVVSHHSHFNKMRRSVGNHISRESFADNNASHV